MSTSYGLIVREQIHCPRGGFFKATLIYFQITCTAVVPLNPYNNEGGSSVIMEAAIHTNGGGFLPLEARLLTMEAS
jgi:hypothetical protein